MDESSLKPTRIRGWALALGAGVAIPALVLIVIEATLMVGVAVTGTNLRLPDVSLNLAEAVAVRDGAEMMRLLEGGEDPSRRQSVREGLLEGKVVQATPLEAAVSIRRTELVDTLYAHGASADQESWRRMVCFATRQESNDIVALLKAHAPSAVEATCAEEEPLW